MSTVGARLRADSRRQSLPRHRRGAGSRTRAWLDSMRFLCLGWREHQLFIPFEMHLALAVKRSQRVFGSATFLSCELSLRAGMRLAL